MPRPFALPDLGEGLTEAEIVKVLVGEGDVVAEDAPLLEVETDKATVEIPSPFAGRVARVHIQPGQTVKVGEVLVTFDDSSVASAGQGRGGGGRGRGASEPHSPRTPPPTSAPRPHRQPSAAAEDGEPSTTQTVGGSGRAGASAPAMATGTGIGVGPVPATPATRRLARELGVELRAVRATGPAGRVTDDDVRAAASGSASRSSSLAARVAPAQRGQAVAEPGAAAPTRGGADAERAQVAKPLAPIGAEAPPLPRFEQWGPVQRQPLSHLRRTIAERMALSATLIPHVTHFDRADVTELDAIIRRSVEPARERGLVLTLTSFLLKAAALALKEHPQFNASLDGAAGELILKRYYHLGVAVATERGLIVPVIRDVDRKPLVELQRELATLAQRVREGKATLDDLRGGTFTITNIGALGGTGAIPIINYPEAAILGVARAREEPVVLEGRIVPRTLLPISLTFDHRVADGADGARFAAAIVRRLERPEQLLLDW